MTLASVLLLLFPAPVDYRRLQLHELAAVAERVVVGEIVAVQEDTYELAVERTLVGVHVERLRLRRFDDWTCAGRWAPYREGQRMLVFARGERALGAGNEGEMPLVGAGALVPYSVRGHRFVERPVDGGELHASWVPLAGVAGALSAFRSSFDFELHDYVGVRASRPRTGAAELEELAGASSFARELFDDIARCRCVEAPEDPRVLRAGDRSWTRSSFTRVALRRRAGAHEILASSGSVLRTPESVLEPIDAERLEAPERERRALFGPDFGAGLCVWTDLDADGADEIVVSAAMEFDAHAGRPDQPHVGSVFLFHWNDGQRLVAEIGDSDAHPGLVDGCRFGRALETVGDLDLDGLPELAVARSTDATFEDGKWTRPQDSLALLFLDRAGAVRRWTSLAPSDVGHESPAEFASVLAAPGDIDGDSVPDLVLGEPLDCAEGAYRGALRVLFLTADGRVRGWTRIGTEAFGLADGDELGVALAAVGDLDGDGVPDLVAAGVDALWSVRLARDGSARAVRRFALAELQPGAVEVVALAAHEHGARADGTVRLLTSARRGTAKPLDVGLDWLAVSDDGEIRQD
jgi:hypothetical protein